MEGRKRPVISQQIFSIDQVKKWIHCCPGYSPYITGTFSSNIHFAKHSSFACRSWNRRSISVLKRSKRLVTPTWLPQDFPQRQTSPIRVMWSRWPSMRLPSKHSCNTSMSIPSITSKWEWVSIHHLLRFHWILIPLTSLLLGTPNSNYADLYEVLQEIGFFVAWLAREEQSVEHPFPVAVYPGWSFSKWHRQIFWKLIT